MSLAEAEVEQTSGGSDNRPTVGDIVPSPGNPSVGDSAMPTLMGILNHGVGKPAAGTLGGSALTSVIGGEDPSSPVPGSTRSSSPTLILSEGSPSPPPSPTPRPQLQPPRLSQEEMNYVFFRDVDENRYPGSVLTHEHSDPLLSAAPNVCSRRPYEPPSEMWPIHNTRTGARVGEDATMNNPSHCHWGRFQLLGCFSMSLDSYSGRKKNYVINVFDKGCLFTPGSEVSRQILAHLGLDESRVSFDVMCVKNDMARMTFDQIFVHIYRNWVVMMKPGTSHKAIQHVESGSQFFVQTTAIERIGMFFRKATGWPWIVSAKLVKNVSTNTAHQNEDFAFLIAEMKKIPPAESNVHRSQEIVPLQHTLHLGSETITLHAATSSLPSPQSSSSLLSRSENQSEGLPESGHANGIQPNSIIKLRSQFLKHVELQARRANCHIVNRQYQALNEEQAFHCTFCTTCKKRFKFVIDHLFHFTMSSPCRAAIINNGNRSDNNPQLPKSFYVAFNNVLAVKCKLPSPNHRLLCDVCGTETGGPLPYGLHRDQHGPLQRDLYLCQFCSIMFRTPYSFIRHDCIKAWNATKTIRNVTQLDNTWNAATSSKTDKPSNPFSIYNRLSDSERKVLLSCPSCGKEQLYVSGLISHFRSSSTCLLSLQRHSTDMSPEMINLSPHLFGRSEAQKLHPRLMSCEECGVVCNNQLGYAMHRDHHTLRQEGALLCKACRIEYHSPCEFYRHSCSEEESAQLFWCPFCDLSRHCDIARWTMMVRQAEKQRHEQVRRLKEQIPSRQTKDNSLVSLSIPLNGTKNSLHNNPNPTIVESPRKSDERNQEGAPADVLPSFDHIFQPIPADSATVRKHPDSPSDLHKTHKRVAEQSLIKEETKARPMKKGRRSFGPDLPHDSFLCMDCSPFRILQGAEKLASHCRESDNHVDIQPLWTFNQLSVALTDFRKLKIEM